MCGIFRSLYIPRTTRRQHTRKQSAIINVFSSVVSPTADLLSQAVTLPSSRRCVSVSANCCDYANFIMRRIRTNYGALPLHMRNMTGANISTLTRCDAARRRLLVTNNPFVHIGK